MSFYPWSELETCTTCLWNWQLQLKTKWFFTKDLFTTRRESFIGSFWTGLFQILTLVGLLRQIGLKLLRCVKLLETLNLNRFDFLLQIPSVCLPHWDVIYSNLESFVKFKQFQVWAATCWVEVPGEAACVSLQLLFNKSIQILAKKSLEILLNKSIQQLYKKWFQYVPANTFQ